MSDDMFHKLMSEVSGVPEVQGTPVLQELEGILAVTAAPAELLNKSQAELREAAENGQVDLKSAIGQRFSRTAGVSSEYKALRTQEEKRRFRAEWAQTQWQATKETLHHSESDHEKYMRKGELVPFASLVVWQGGKDDPAAVRAATNYAGWCLKMGPPWAVYNKMTERLDFLKIEQKYMSEFEMAWQKKKSGAPHSAMQPQVFDKRPALLNKPHDFASPARQAPAEKAKPKARPRAHAKAKGKGCGAPKPVTESREPATVSRDASSEPALKQTKRKGRDSGPKSVSKVMADMASVKSKVSTASFACNALIVKLDDPAWAWANTAAMRDPLVALRDKVADLLSQDFAAQVMSLPDLSCLQEDHDERLLIERGRQFVESIGPCADELNEEISGLTRMHRIRMSKATT